ncbi:MAG: zinc-binding dehydrogenase [Myxococcota bacterium]
MIGCAIQTGVGAVLNTAKVEEGATVLVMGLGGIGISIVQGARLANAARIIVSDPVAERRDYAANFGATDVLDPTQVDVVAKAIELTGGIGVDYAFDGAGRTPS